MKLTAYPYELKLQHTFTVATMSRTTTPDVQISIEHDGIIGYGEASMPPYLGHTVESVMAFLQKVDLEQFTTLNIPKVLQYLDSLSLGDAPGKAAIDMALHDIAGKMENKPVYALYEIDPARQIDTSYTIGIDTEDVVIAKTQEVADKFNVFKVKVGRARQEDFSMINAIRKVTDKPLFVDANQGWKDRREALDMIHWLADQGVVLIEQPMPKEQLDDIAFLTQNSPIPVIADESIQRLNDIDRINGAFSGINVKLMKCTGIYEGYQMIQKAKELGMKTMLGCMTETSCAVTAAAHLSPIVDYADLDGNLLIANDKFKGVQVINGKLQLNKKPGLGLIVL